MIMSEPTSQAPLNPELERDSYRIVRSEIEHEDQLINHRLSWLVSSQSFLLTAYAICLNAPMEFHRQSYERLNRVLFNLLPYAGLLTTVLIYPTILAAVISLARLRRFANRHHHLGLPPVHGALLTAFLGLSGPLTIPWVFAIAWALVLRNQ